MSMSPTIRAYSPAERYFITDSRLTNEIHPPSLVVGTYTPPRGAETFKLAIPLQVYQENTSTGVHRPVTPLGRPDEVGRVLKIRA
jgi:hypothetical protein